MKKTSLLLIILSCIQSIKSQEMGVAIEGAYSYKIGNDPLSQFYLGGVCSYGIGNRGYGDYNNQFTLGVGTYYGRYNRRDKWIPAATLGYGKAAGLFYKATVTPYNIVPSVNYNLFNMAQVGVGYSFGYKHINGQNMNGLCLTFNLSLNIIGHWISPNS